VSGLLLALDVGNSRISVGVFDHDSLCFASSIETDRSMAAVPYSGAIRDLLTQEGVAIVALAGAALSSVVPSLTQVIREACEVELGLTVAVAGDDLRIDLPVRYDPPGTLGTDRRLNALAARRRFGGPVVIADLGTATKIDAVSGDGEFIGGMIAPGAGSAFEGLLSAAPHLPRIEIAQSRVLLGRSTRECVQSGAYYGQICLVEGVVSRLRRDLGPATPAIATGGFSSLLIGTGVVDEVRPHLTLEGLDLAWKSQER
jgi:type III pantothenate kinase